MQDTPTAPTCATPTPLDVYCECLLIIQTLEPHECVAVMRGLGLVSDGLLRGDAVDWKSQSERWEKKARELQAVADDLFDARDKDEGEP